MKGDVYLRFTNKRYITKGINSVVSLSLQFFMWQCIDKLDVPKDYLQVFNCTMYDGKQKITHIQEEPEYKKEYLFSTDAPIFIGKIFVIDNDAYTTMMLANEY